MGFFLGFINYNLINKNVNFDPTNEQKTIPKMVVVVISFSLTLLATTIFTEPIERVFYVLFWNLLLITSWIDFCTSTINVLMIYVVTAINSILLLFQNVNFGQHLLGGMVCFLIYFMIYLVSRAYYKREAFGFGDVILMGSIGLHLGLSKGILVAFLSFYIALLFIIIMRIVGKNLNRQTELPFGPYMCLAGVLVSIFGDRIIQFYLRVAFG